MIIIQLLKECVPRHSINYFKHRYYTLKPEKHQEDELRTVLKNPCEIVGNAGNTHLKCLTGEKRLRYGKLNIAPTSTLLRNWKYLSISPARCCLNIMAFFEHVSQGENFSIERTVVQGRIVSQTTRQVFCMVDWPGQGSTYACKYRKYRTRS